jgi:sulfite reductase (ferredoxin)
LKAAEALELPLEPSSFRRGVIACTGSEYCKLALTETKAFASDMIDELERRMPRYTSQIKIHVNGCPNACGQHWIADVGLQGVKLKDGSDGYEVYAGGGVAGWAAVAQRLPFRAPATAIPDAIERLLQAYLAEREEGEVFQAFARRHSPEELKAFLAGVGPAEVE